MEARERKRPGRRAFVPSPEQRETVRRMAGSPHARIASMIGVSVPTLRKAFADDLKAPPGDAGLFDPELVRRIEQQRPARLASGGRRRLKPTDEQRRRVMELAALGRSVKAIARALNMTEPTLRKHFAAEIETGAEKIEAEIIKALMAKARGGSVAAQKQVLHMIEAARLEQMQAQLGQPQDARTEAPGKKLQAALDAAEVIEKTPILAHLRH